jgi:hypothetical protein
LLYKCSTDHLDLDSTFILFAALFIDNELYYTAGKEGVKKKVVFSIEEISEILQHHHSDAMGGHSGVNATLNKVSAHYLWNGMKEDIQEYVSTPLSTKIATMNFQFVAFSD